MSLQHMELFDLLTQRNARTSNGVWVDDRIKQQLNSAVRLNGEVASQVYYESDQEVWRLDDGDFPPLNLPFPTMWIEWKIPTSWRSLGKTVSGEHAGWRMGVVVTQSPSEPDSPTRAASRLDMCLAVLQPGRLPFLSSTSVSYDLDVNGIGFGKPLNIGVDTVDDISVLVQPALLAIGLMNCKNVTLGTGNFRPRRAAGNNRKRVPRIDYHTIILPGHSTQSPPTKSGLPGVQTLPQHRVRGHFKTYTDAAKLLGKHTGTYWWGWQVRGSKAGGFSVTDYALGGAK